MEFNERCIATTLLLSSFCNISSVFRATGDMYEQASTIENGDQSPNNRTVATRISGLILFSFVLPNLSRSLVKWYSILYVHMEMHVLPSRSHPHMHMSSYGGYVLSGIRISTT